jgi:hypothetical protein
MTLDYSKDGKVKILIVDYIRKMLAEIPDDMDGEAATRAANHLFEVNESADKLDKETSQLFHHNVAKLLFLCKRAEPDVQGAVAFLTTRVQQPDVDDYKKLRRAMQYLRSTADLPLTLEADNAHIVKWFVNASFAVHPDIKSHTGGMMSLGKGTAYGTSTRQKLTTTKAQYKELH